MVIDLPPVRLRQLALALLVLTFSVSVGCGGGSANAGGPTPTPAPSSTPTPVPAPGAGLLMKVGSATVPTGGIYQYQLLLTEPKPIGNSSTRPTIPKGPTGPVRGVAVNDASGQAVGIAVISDTSTTVTVKSPNLTLGTDPDYPLFTMTMPVTSTATGSQFAVNLDGANSSFLNGNGQAYTVQELVGGTLTIGGTLSITDVIPGGGVLHDGDSVTILGVGFDANTKIQINNTTITSTNLISPNRIDVKVSTAPAASIQLDGDRIRAINKTANETVEYFSYDRTDDVPGASSRQLVTLVHPMFSQQNFNLGTIPYVSTATQFTGMALQNAANVDSTISVELLASTGATLSSTSFVLPARRKIVRDILDWFPAPPANVTTVRATVTAGPAVKMLGMAGDTAAGTVTPVIVTGQ